MKKINNFEKLSEACNNIFSFDDVKGFLKLRLVGMNGVSENLKSAPDVIPDVLAEAALDTKLAHVRLNSISGTIGVLCAMGAGYILLEAVGDYITNTAIAKLEKRVSKLEEVGAGNNDVTNSCDPFETDGENESNDDFAEV